MKALALVPLIAVLLLSSVGARADFFAKYCVSGSWAVIEVLRTEDFKNEAKRRGLNSDETREYIERAKRLSFLTSAYQNADHATLRALKIMPAYERALIDEAPKSKDEIWRKVLSDTFNYPLTDGEFRGNDRVALAILLPGTLDPNVAPTEVALSIAILDREALLAKYRVEVSKALCELSLDKQILAHSEQEIAAAVAKGEKKADETKPRMDLKELDRLSPTDPFDVAAWNVKIREAATKMSEDPRIPENSRKQLKMHLDFMDKYSLPANQTFRVHVVNLLAFLKQTTR